MFLYYPWSIINKFISRYRKFSKCFPHIELVNNRLNGFCIFFVFAYGIRESRSRSAPWPFGTGARKLYLNYMSSPGQRKNYWEILQHIPGRHNNMIFMAVFLLPFRWYRERIDSRSWPISVHFIRDNKILWGCKINPGFVIAICILIWIFKRRIGTWYEMVEELRSCKEWFMCKLIDSKEFTRNHHMDG